VIWFGVQQGIERSVKVLMPALFALLVGLAVYNVIVGEGFGEALRYLFTPDFSRITGTTLLAAIGQAFFSIGVGMAGMMTFGAYLPREIPVVTCAIVIALVDTSVAILAGLVIFPMVFAQGLDAAGGAGLIFNTLPVAFAQMPGGGAVAALFFLLLAFAAITSLVGLLEAQVAWVMDRFGSSRHRAVAGVGALVFAGSMVGVLSFNAWADVRVFDLSLEAFLDFLPNQVMLPLGGLLIAIFAAWILPRAVAADAVNTAPRTFAAWRFLLRFVIPPAVLGILVYFVAGA